MADRIEFGELFSALLFLTVSVFVAIIPGGFLLEWAVHPRPLLSNNCKAETLHQRGFVVFIGLYRD